MGVRRGNLTFKQSLRVWGMNLEGIGKNVLSARTHPRESEMICAIFIDWVKKQKHSLKSENGRGRKNRNLSLRLRSHRLTKAKFLWKSLKIQHQVASFPSLPSFHFQLPKKNQWTFSATHCIRPFVLTHLAKHLLGTIGFLVGL